MDLRLHEGPDGPCLHRADAGFDPWQLAWQPAPPRPGGQAVTPLAALAALSAARLLRGVPVAVIGPREASAAELAAAEAVGLGLGRAGLVLLCGGKGGAMEAACRGARRGGGLTLGLLPDEEWQGANDHVAIPIATGIGPARNAILARAAVALIAVGGAYGTLSEMALGMQFNRLVLALGQAPEVPGVIRCDSPEAAVERVARHLLGMS
ncbi:hypothetical protein [Falsiroseomonas sp. E2-1-a4]|uniref:SLOG cluster 4 domain-containing protein n=1 Tax=Falsiroseomonas sp. E2-1-a4 TaxID=3239299 RepID=UPI003F3D2A5D